MMVDIDDDNTIISHWLIIRLVEEKVKVLKLACDEVDPDIFNLMIEFLYSNSLPAELEEQKASCY